MKISEKRDFGLPLPEKPNEIDPALLTTQEYLKFVNPTNKMHPSGVYDVTLDRLNAYDTIEKFPRLFRRIKVNGLWFEVRLQTEKNRYTKKDEDGEYLRDEFGQPIPYTDEEISRLGYTKFNYTLGIFNEEKQKVAVVQDEWGCVLVMVAEEYRGFGFGVLLVKLARSITPSKTSGGFTPSGQNNLIKVHREFVRDALTNGTYSRLVKRGEMTLQRVKEIVNSVDLKTRINFNKVNLGTSDTKDWMIYEEYGAFVIYDKKLKELLEDRPPYDDFCERMILGLIFIRSYNDKFGIVKAFGASTDKLKRILLKFAVSYCDREKITLVLDPEDVQFVDPKDMQVSLPHYKSGYERFEVTPTGNLIEYDDLIEYERRFRRSFDKYDEFKNTMLEMAFAKFQNSGEG